LFSELFSVKFNLIKGEGGEGFMNSLDLRCLNASLSLTFSAELKIFLKKLKERQTQFMKFRNNLIEIIS